MRLPRKVQDELKKKGVDVTPPPGGGAKARQQQFRRARGLATPEEEEAMRDAEEEATLAPREVYKPFKPRKSQP
jgi:hypothetical protein